MYPAASEYPAEPDLAVEVEEPPNGPAPEAASFSGRLPLAGGILLAIVAEAFLGLALALPKGPHLMLVIAGVPIISGLFALGSCLMVGVVARGRERGAWVVMGLACVGVLVAQGARFMPDGPSPIPHLSLASTYPSVASVALIAQSVGLFLAFLLFPPPMQGRATLGKLRLVSDGILIVGTALIGASYFLLLPLSQSSSGTLTPARMTTLAICIGDLLLLTGLTFALRAIDQRQTPLYGALCILGLAVLLLIGSDATSIFQTPDTPASLNSWLQATWNAGYLCIGLGAMVRLRGSGRGRAGARLASTPHEGANFWLILPFGLAILMGGAIMVHALTAETSPAQALVALVCLSLLIVLIGGHHLVGLFEVRRMREQVVLLAQEADMAEAEVEELRSGQLIQGQARQESLRQLQEVLAHFSQGEYQVRAGMLERELVPLGSSLNLFLDNIAQTLSDASERDRGREARLLRILTDALGRLALGELHDLPDLPSPAGTGLEGLVKGVVQIRTRLINLQQSLQQYNAERQEVEQRLGMARQELEQDAQAQRQMALEMAKNLEVQLENERLVAQASEAQRQRLEAQLQAAEAQTQAAEAALKATEDMLLKERREMDQRLRAERQALEEQLRSASQPNSALAGRLRKQGEQLVAQFTSQAERLHASAAIIQTASEVARGLARSIEETAALPELQGKPQAAPESAQPATALQPSSQQRQLSAMQMLEKLAGLRTGDTTPQPAVVPVPAALPGHKSGPLDETSNERVIRRLRTAATRAEEIATGLYDLAKECIAAGDASLHAAEETSQLLAELARPTSAVPLRTSLPTRAPKAGR